ncbi:GNAT family N-acetyltransferase [Actinomycetaceae bacterium MB13-C1-2]|nr:GNAT family N-acetyltransferase [Actinomycetaceae bacterium MB13-C1-2]
MLKARSVSPVIVRDETYLAREDFAPYFALLEDSEAAPEFASWSRSTYSKLIERLTPGHVRLYAARYEDQLISWLLFTISGVEAVCEWSARSAASADIDALAQTALAAAVDLADQGIERLELREGIHPEAHRQGSLAFLRQELTGEYTETSITYDLPLNRIAEGIMWIVSSLRSKLGR